MTSNTQDTYLFRGAENYGLSDQFDNHGELSDLSVEELLYGAIDIEDQPYSRDMLSPTPIDPYDLVTHGSSYPNGAMHYMEGMFTTRLDELGIELPPFHEEAILSEINMSHNFQVQKNSQSISCLREKFANNPHSFMLDQARAIYLERIGQGTSERRLRIVAEHDEVDSIEDMKITAPLDERKVLLGLKEYYTRLQAIAEKGDVSIDFIPAHQQPIRMIDVNKTAHPGTLVTKRTIAVAHINGKVIELRQKDSYVCIPADIDLGTAIPVIRRIKDMDMNIQHVAVSSYWAVRHPEVESAA